MLTQCRRPGRWPWPSADHRGAEGCGATRNAPLSAVYCLRGCEAHGNLAAPCRIYLASPGVSPQTGSEEGIYVTPAMEYSQNLSFLAAHHIQEEVALMDPRTQLRHELGPFSAEFGPVKQALCRSIQAPHLDIRLVGAIDSDREPGFVEVDARHGRDDEFHRLRLLGTLQACASVGDDLLDGLFREGLDQATLNVIEAPTNQRP